LRDNAVKELSGTGVSPVRSESVPTSESKTHGRDAHAIKKLAITRFKGLGEMLPKEFAQFIGKEMRLSKVEYAQRAESAPILNFYMGKNKPERKY